MFVHLILREHTLSSGKYHDLDDIYPEFYIWNFVGVYFTAHLGLEMDRPDQPSRTRRWLFPMFVVGTGLLLIASSLYILQQNAADQPDLIAVPAKVNYAAPELTLTDLQGKPGSLVNLRGQVILVNLWATWCPPCKAEMPTLEKYYRKHKEDGFTIVAVNDGDPAADVQEFVNEYRLTFPVWLDPTFIATEQAFKTLNLPSSFVIDRDGTIVLSWFGGINTKNLEQYVTPIIEKN